MATLPGLIPVLLATVSASLVVYQGGSRVFFYQGGKLLDIKGDVMLVTNPTLASKCVNSYQGGHSVYQPGKVAQ